MALSQQKNFNKWWTDRMEWFRSNGIGMIRFWYLRTQVVTITPRKWVLKIMKANFLAHKEKPKGHWKWHCRNATSKQKLMLYFTELIWWLWPKECLLLTGAEFWEEYFLLLAVFFGLLIERVCSSWHPCNFGQGRETAKYVVIGQSGRLRCSWIFGFVTFQPF